MSLQVEKYIEERFSAEEKVLYNFLVNGSPEVLLTYINEENQETDLEDFRVLLGIIARAFGTSKELISNLRTSKNISDLSEKITQMGDVISVGEDVVDGGTYPFDNDVDVIDGGEYPFESDLDIIDGGRFSFTYSGYLPENNKYLLLLNALEIGYDFIDTTLDYSQIMEQLSLQKDILNIWYQMIKHRGTKMAFTQLLKAYSRYLKVDGSPEFTITEIPSTAVVDILLGTNIVNKLNGSFEPDNTLKQDVLLYKIFKRLKVAGTQIVIRKSS